jgi:hypothetical protein
LSGFLVNLFLCKEALMLFRKLIASWRLARVLKLTQKRDCYEQSLQKLYSDKINMLQEIQRHKDNKPSFLEYAFAGGKILAGLGLAAAGVAVGLDIGDAAAEIGSATGFMGHAVGHNVFHGTAELGGHVMANTKGNVFNYGTTLDVLEKQLLRLEKLTINTSKKLQRIKNKLSAR